MKANLNAAKTDIQLLVRAEAGAVAMGVRVYRLGSIHIVKSAIGECACVTCGFVGPYKSPRGKGKRQMQGGHFAGRRASVALVEHNVHPQCSLCNLTKPGHGGGMPKEYELYMLEVYGQEFVDVLRFQARNTSKHWQPDELIAIRKAMRARIRLAEKIIARGDMTYGIMSDGKFH